ncbi:MAG: LytTR family DNA-binding domain-containing protein [Spirochaetia bacterium]|nr:LytTR family DNA-binding domain-containing protein [Spirochaetia bacterium]
MKTKPTVIIAEDELPIRVYIQKLLSQKKEFKLAGVAKDGLELEKLLIETKPDIALLDIDLPIKNTLDVLSEIDNLPLIIFITSYDEYAIKAYEIGVVDYIVKPFNESRLFTALNRAINVLNLKKEKKDELIDYLWLKLEEKILPIAISDIIYLEADDKYTNLFAEKKRYRVCKSLSRIFNLLDKKDFIQVHRKYVLRKSVIKQIEPLFNGNYLAILHNEAQIPISRGHFKKIKNQII